jgi:hypothetical protein
MKKGATNNRRFWRHPRLQPGDHPRLQPGEGLRLRDDPILRAVKAADPTAEQDFDGWAASAEGRRVFARIAARREQPAGRSDRRPGVLWATLVAAGAFVAVAVIVVGVAIGVREWPSHVAQSSTTTIPADAADRVAVLAKVVEVTDLSSVIEAPSHEAELGVPVATQARKLGIISPSDFTWASSHGKLDRATFALWIWRGVGGRLTQVRQVDLADLGPLPQDVRIAVTGVVDAGLLDPTGDGLFEPDRTLRTPDVEEAFRRLQEMLGS